MNTLLFTFETIAFTTLLTSGIFQSIINFPHEGKLSNLHTCKRLIQAACFILGISSMIMFTGSYISQIRNIVFYVQIVAHLESFLLTLAMMNLLEQESDNRKFIKIHTVFLPLVILLISISHFIIKINIGSWSYLLLVLCYIGAFLYYFYVCLNKYRKWIKQQSQGIIYKKRILSLWSHLNIMALLVITILIIPSPESYTIFIATYVPFFISFIVQFNLLGERLKLNNYVQKLGNPKKHRASKQDNLGDDLNQWLESKGYLNGNITVMTLSKDLHTNRTYLSNYINETYGENFNSWLNRLRVEEAKKRMIQEPVKGINLIAEEIGFTDISHFSKIFKQVTGLPPSSWRKQNHKDSDDQQLV